jgi:hypothetical protein
VEFVDFHFIPFIVFLFSLSHDSWIYHTCNQYQSSCEFEPRSWRGAFDTILWDQVSQWLATGRWFLPGTPVSSTNKTDRHDITKIVFKVELNTVNPNLTFSFKPLRLYTIDIRLCTIDTRLCTIDTQPKQQSAHTMLPTQKQNKIYWQTSTTHRNESSWSRMISKLTRIYI